MSAALSTYLSIITLSISALAWTIAAFSAPVIDTVCEDDLQRANFKLKVERFANAAAAVLAAFGVAFQAYANYAALLPAK